MSTAARRSGGLFEGLYRVLMRRNSVYVTFVIVGAFVGERVVDYGVHINSDGAIKCLVPLLDPTSEMVDKAVALLANLSTVKEGCLVIAREGGIPLLVEVIETGSQQRKENATSILLQLCLSSPKYCRLVLQEGAVPPLVALSQSGTPRGKEKAQQLLSLFRNQRENSMGRGRS